MKIFSLTGLAMLFLTVFGFAQAEIMPPCCENPVKVLRELTSQAYQMVGPKTSNDTTGDYHVKLDEA
jgi:hypothetical protein